MPRNPYLAAYELQRRNRRREPGAFRRLLGLVVPIAGAILLVPLFRPVFLAFLDADPARLGSGMEAVLLRLGLALVAILALDVYTAIIRGPDREVLDLHPVDPGDVVAFQVVRVARERWWLPALGALLLVPVALEGTPLAWVLGVLLLLGAYVLGLTGSALMHLLAVDAAESERFAPWLDLLRGSNPREQAAFLYAPGVVLAACGGLVALAGTGVRVALEGQGLAAAALLVLPVAAGLAWVPVRRLADRSWFRATGVLADIDARYAQVEGKEEALRVYLDWTVRFLPSRWALYALKDLRHGWRARRGYITGAWFGGVAAALAGWSAHPSAPARAAAVAAAACFVCATIGVLLERDEPELLRRWLPAGGLPRWGARALVLFGWLQGTVWLAVAASAVRHGSAGAGTVLLVGQGAVVLAALLALACSVVRERGLYLYGPMAAVAAAGTAAWLLGGGGGA